MLCRHPTSAVRSYSSGPPAAKTAMGGFSTEIVHPVYLSRLDRPRQIPCLARSCHVATSRCGWGCSDREYPYGTIFEDFCWILMNYIPTSETVRKSVIVGILSQTLLPDQCAVPLKRQVRWRQFRCLFSSILVKSLQRSLSH